MLLITFLANKMFATAGKRKADIMANPYLPNWEYIPDGEPRIFGNRVYVYGSHDQAGSQDFCDYVLKCWSAPLDNLNHWTCHGDIFTQKPTVTMSPILTGMQKIQDFMRRMWWKRTANIICMLIS